ncbi:MAG: hypothetical protein METHP_00638 [Methanoregula sp. SKADARSKE-2]|nr:MAG: hypothetical protein METHP_00638 [Methanoregula sp. SKADARSKE-2]
MIESRMLICPGWSIAGKFMLPGHSADSDSILEPNEQFELLIFPSDTTVPYQESTVIIDPARRFLFRSPGAHRRSFCL